MEELTGEALNDAQYNTIATTSETLDVVIEEYLMAHTLRDLLPKGKSDGQL